MFILCFVLLGLLWLYLFDVAVLFCCLLCCLLVCCLFCFVVVVVVVVVVVYFVCLFVVLHFRTFLLMSPTKLGPMKQTNNTPTMCLFLVLLSYFLWL